MRVARGEAALEASDEREALTAAISALLRRQHVEGPHHGTQRKPEPLRQLARRRKTKPVGKYAQDGGWFTIQRHHATTYVWIGGKASTPQAVSNQHHATASLVAQLKTATDDRLYAENLKELRAHAYGANPLGLAAPGL